ncbi:hypothetical protein P3W45_000121 [Vairimorpha bombi]|jgi:GINS complex subunit 3
MTDYSLENALVNETKVRVKFKHRINNFGFFISDLFENIEPDAKVDIPLYIAKFFLENKHCTLCNEIIQEDIKNDIRANSSIINLSSMYSYFYYFVSNFYDKEYVIEIMFSRYNKLYTLILKERLDEDDIFILDATEKRIIVEARRVYLIYRSYFINL